jgi:hypothetical protein
MGTSTPQLIVLKELEGNQPTSLDPVQTLLAPHVDALTAFWITLWCLTAIVLLIRLAREYLEHRKRR